MKKTIRMELLSDTIFGNGESIPGEEDISVLCDSDGFPYYKGGTFKGIFREELERYIVWTKAELNSEDLLGKEDDNDERMHMRFADFHISEYVKDRVKEETGGDKNEVLRLFTNTRTFTKLENGMIDPHSLRIARCVDKGLSFYSEITFDPEYEDVIREVLGLIKWIGTLRNRGFGNVKITVEEDVNE